MRRARRDATYGCRGRTWQIRLPWARQIGYRLLEKHGKSDRDNVRCLTGVAAWQPFPGGWGWFHVKPMAKPPPGVLHKTLRTELSTKSVTSSCRMALMTAGLSFPEVDPSCAVAREDEPDAAAMWILEVGRRVRRVRRDGRRCAEMEECGRYICFGRCRSSAVHWGSTANPSVTTCAAGLKGQAWCALPGGYEPVSRETAVSR